ncbi:dockerin type I domain-containing protein, partial [Clostridium cibarium]
TGIKLYVPYEYKDTVKESQSPAFYKVTATADKSYEINNSTAKSISVVRDSDYSNKYEYIDYDKTGEITKQVVGEYDDFAVESGHKRRISLNTGTGIKLYVPYEYKDIVKESQSPAFYKVTATADKSYEINNNTGKRIWISSYDNIFNKYEYVDYDGTGKLAKQDYGEYKDFVIENGHKKIVSLNTGNGAKLYIPYEYKSTVKESQNPAFSKFVVSKNVSLEIINSSDEVLYLLSTSSISNKYNYINYDENNKISQIWRDQYDMISIGGRNKKKICSSDNRNIVIYVPYDKSKNAKIINEPVFQELLLDKDKNYEIGNNTDDTFTSLVKEIGYNKSSYDFMDFDNNGKITKVERDILENNNIEPHHKIRMSLFKGNGLKLYIPYENRNMIKEVSTPVFYQFNLEKNKTYEIINKTGIDVVVYNYNKESELKYDLVKYDENGNIISSYKDTDGSFWSVNNKREKISISQGENSILYIPYEMKDMIKSTNIPVFYEKHIEKGKSYEVVNNSDKSIKVSKNQTGNNYYELIEYDENGDMEKYIPQSGEFIIEGKHKGRLKAKTGEEFNLYLPYEYKDIIKEVSMAPYYEVNLSKGEQCVIKNNSDHLLYFATSSSSSDRYSICVYDSNTRLINYANPIYSNSMPVKANESIVIEGGKAQTVTLKIPYEAMGFDEKYENEDLNKDGQVDMLDLAIEGNSYNRTYKDKKWVGREDVNFDGIIDIYDMVRVSKKVS